MTKKRVYGAGVWIAVSICGATPLYADQLVAPPPPEAVAAERAVSTVPEDVLFSRTFYTKRDLDEVLAFYEAEIGGMEPVADTAPEAGEAYRGVAKEVTVRVRVSKGYGYEPPPSELGVTVTVRGKPTHVAGCGREVKMHLTGAQQTAETVSPDDVEALCDRYRHQEYSYFDTDVSALFSEYRRRATGRYGATAETTREHGEHGAAVQQALQEAGVIDESGEMDMDAAVEAAMSGRLGGAAEAGAAMRESGRRAAGEAQVSPEHVWQIWRDYLEELDTHAYPVKVTIHSHPSEWDGYDYRRGEVLRAR